MRLTLLLTVALYAFSVLDLHEWVHVPQSIAHWLEHHTDLGHHDERSGHHHDEHGDHDPFGCEDHGACTAFASIGVALEQGSVRIHVPVMGHERSPLTNEDALAAYCGSKWNPPKLG